MGTFINNIGNTDIPEDKWEEFEEHITKIFNIGGSMSVSIVQIFDKTIHLIEPPQKVTIKDAYDEEYTLIRAGFNYFEEETGYYSCSNCGTVSQIRCGTELDYTFPMKTMKSKVRNNEDDEIISDDGNMIEDINELYSQKYSFEGETLMNISTTNIKSSRGYETSTFNDLSSIYSRSMRKKIIIGKTV